MTHNVSKDDIARAVAVLKDGELVAFPTETVYGLGADASNVEAVRKVYAAKGRPADHPLIVHVADAVQLANWTREIPPAAHALAKKYWPGPLTLVLKRNARVPDEVTGGQDTVALRVPGHPVAQQLLRAFGGGIAAPSANRFGRVSATTAEHVREEFGDAVACVLDGGAADVGIESTIVDCSGAVPTLLRPGWITPQQLEAVLGVPLAVADAAAPRVSGTLEKHYAPRTPLMLVEGDLVVELARSLVRQGKRVAALVRTALRPLMDGLVWVAAPDDAAGFAHDLYANLRELDQAGCDVILVEQPPERAEWFAIRDRLNRATAGSGEDLD
ncbi:MAG: L-threonylcarbamoyladenylate synthase [Betaproteobacteria bacterium]|nr:L-threonylcarbamoyladenylate synthase [Betaproteobacteria bacterium]